MKFNYVMSKVFEIYISIYLKNIGGVMSKFLKQYIRIYLKNIGGGGINLAS